MERLPEYWPYLVSVATAAGGAIAWLTARLTARRELDGRMMSVALTLIEPLEERVKALEDENERLRGRVRTLEAENAELRTEVDELRVENAELRQMTQKPPRKARGRADGI